MQTTPIVGVMGGGAASAETLAAAYELGRRVAGAGWILLNGGRRAGVMDASARGAFEAGGLTIGILPDSDPAGASPWIRVPVLTGMGNARNVINVLSSHAVVACPGGAGTLSEIALALKVARPVILMGFEGFDFLRDFDRRDLLQAVDTPGEAVRRIAALPGFSRPE